VLFGLAVGMLLGAHGLWRSELPPFRVLLVGGVELPATALLYLYLKRLADHLPGQARREALARLTWLVPLISLAGALMLGAGWMLHDPRKPTTDFAWQAVLGLGTLYGAAALAIGVMATAAVGSLAAAFFHAGFPTAWRWTIGTRGVVRHLSAWRRRITATRLRGVTTAAGAALLVLAMLIGLDHVLWIQSRHGVGGNLPFVNFPGPKVWATVVFGPLGGRSSWSYLGDRYMLFAINLAAIWLLSASARPGRLRLAVRWLPVILIGGVLGGVAASRNGEVFGVHFYGAYWSRFYAAVTVLCEVPSTLLLYLLLARRARDLGRPRLAVQFLGVALAMVALVGTSLAFFVASGRWLNGTQRAGEILLLAAIYGAFALASAVWGVGCLARLAMAALSDTPSAVLTAPDMTAPGINAPDAGGAGQARRLLQG
ncbi:MAG: hypothetical protein ABIP55_02690, partial [Tepidisphaeraceae bacterium]